MDYKSFLVLSALESGERKVFTQRQLAYSIGMSVGSVNSALAAMTQRGWVAGGRITRDGVMALEPFRVKRAVFLAAGFGTRLVPITLNTPKPLVRVHGQRIIDSLLDAVVKAGIEEIYIVRGYYAEQFDQLVNKYPQIRFIENRMYNESNNISSIMAARYVLARAYVIESDLFLSNPSLIQRYQFHSNYLGIPMEQSDDWCFKVEHGHIKGVQIGGNQGVWQMVGISYWSEEDGRRLIGDIERTISMPGGKERYWDEVPLTYCADNYEVDVRRCSASDVTEIDTYAELQRLDSAYRRV